MLSKVRSYFRKTVPKMDNLTSAAIKGEFSNQSMNHCFPFRLVNALLN